MSFTVSKYIILCFWWHCDGRLVEPY
jgi:hypothetical protein